jgi:hypothetical protein
MMQVTLKYLRNNPDSIFVYGDNLKHFGCRGAAIFRAEPNTWGFITKKAPTNDSWAFYQPDEYEQVFQSELDRLILEIKRHPEKTWLISQIGSGLANRNEIWEHIIFPGIESLRQFPNVIFLWEQQ